jgi:mono/diheme cytochrome c family protein
MKASSIVACALLGALVVFRPALADDQATSSPDVGAPAAASPAPVAAAAPVATGDAALYRVVDGDRVDAETLKGWRTWRAMACDRCHGPNQEGMVGPSLLQSLKVMTKEDFKKTLLDGRVEKGMPNFGGTQSVVDNLDQLYAYLKGRADGAINPGKLKGIE